MFHSLEKLLLIILGILILLFGTFAVLTKTGVIANYFEIAILCPDQSTNPDDLQPNDDKKYPLDDYYIVEKPVIYLYPSQKQKVEVSIDYPGKLFVSYPEYENSWNVIANPDGSLINLKDGREYSYLFWEGKDTTYTSYDLSTGFVVKGNDTITFLQEKLEEIGLTPKEYNEFIVYWAPRMINNEYNLIHFASEDEYANRVKLNISPTPDSVLRVFMVYKKLENNINIQPQIFPSFQRTGFAVVEWGGSEIE